MPINNQDKLDTLFKKLEEDIESGKFLEYLKEILIEFEKSIKITD